jgi:hypothetical protein
VASYKVFAKIAEKDSEQYRYKSIEQSDFVELAAKKEGYALHRQEDGGPLQEGIGTVQGGSAQDSKATGERRGLAMTSSYF